MAGKKLILEWIVKMNKHKFTSILSCVMLIAACSSVMATLPPKFGGTLTVSIPDRISKVNPHVATSDYEFNVISCIFETLVEPQPGGGLSPMLLETLPVASDDGLKYYLKLKEGVVFHDGNALDSADVAHSIKKLIKNKKSPYTWIYDGVAGAEDYRSGRSGTVEGIKITDPMRLEITLLKPDKNFISYLAYPAAVIVATSENDFEPPVGTGPFVYYDRTSKGEIVLDAYGNYRNGRPYLDRVEFRPVRDDKDIMISFWRGELDILFEPVGGFEETDYKGLSTGEVTSPMKRMYFMDVNPEKVGGAAIRAAVSSAIDRQGITNVVLNGKAISENNAPGKGDPGKMVKALAGKYRTIWYGEAEKSLTKVVAKIVYDFENRGITLKQFEGTELGIKQYSRENAPEFIVRSLPVLLGMQESISEVLFGDYNPHSRESSMLARLGEPSEIAGAGENSAVLMLFSARRSYLYSDVIKGIEPGPYGNIVFQDIYIRGESERLDN